MTEDTFGTRFPTSSDPRQSGQQDPSDMLWPGADSFDTTSNAQCVATTDLDVDVAASQHEGPQPVQARLRRRPVNKDPSSSSPRPVTGKLRPVLTHSHGSPSVQRRNSKLYQSCSSREALGDSASIKGAVDSPYKTRLNDMAGKRRQLYISVDITH